MLNLYYKNRLNKDSCIHYLTNINNYNLISKKIIKENILKIIVDNFINLLQDRVTKKRINKVFNHILKV